jgi:hypothetical protein
MAKVGRGVGFRGVCLLLLLLFFVVVCCCCSSLRLYMKGVWRKLILSCTLEKFVRKR